MLLVLGGGMAGLTAACRAAELGQEVTVVQRGHRLGGKGASHRTADGRIEEHGLHIWPGYYDNAFALLLKTHGAEGDEMPGLFPAPAVGVAGDAGAPWMARFSTNSRRPGIDAGPLTVADFVRQCGELLTDLITSTSGAAAAAVPDRQVYLSGRPRPSRRAGRTQSPLRLVSELVNTLINTSITYLPRVLQAVPANSPAVTTLLDEIQRATSELRRSQDSPDSSMNQAIDLIMTSLIGIYRDGLLNHSLGFAAINELDFREWLTRHGARQSTVDSGIVRGMYDLTFGYRGGDHGQPAFEAGTGLLLAGRFFFDFKGALFWKMSAGMGDVVFAPLYKYLRTLGVRFLFFHRVHNLGLDRDRSHIQSVELGRQVSLAEGLTEYDPLVDMCGSDVFPEHPLAAQLATAEVPLHLESHYCDNDHEESVVLRRGQDFDDVILATSLGMIPFVCSEITNNDDRWQAMIDNVAVVSTQALQLWAEPTESELGWSYEGSTVAGYDAVFDTYASMSHLVSVEANADTTGSISYFCSALLDSDANGGPEAARSVTRQNAELFLNEQIGQLWPNAVDALGFKWDILVGNGPEADRLEDQYYSANTDPSDRYVQSLPGSGKYRLRADDSGLDNLFLAGDWIDSGLNAGCIEAATIAGTQAANAAAGLPLCEGVLGGWHPIQERSAGERHGNT